ncbi:MAG: hypothetical protein JO214_19370 [Frankiaceae bacterium]|nr:hypothetical protein [Frankiaceae bacterium]
MRVYLPATLPLLRQWLVADAAAVSGPAFAVTPELREWYFEADLEELEHAAQTAAATEALRLIAADPAAAPRRIVIAADVDDGAVSPDPTAGRAAVAVSGPIPRARWGSALVDDETAAPVVRSGAARITAADAGDADAQFEVDEVEAHELGWYAVQELQVFAQPS